MRMNKKPVPSEAEVPLLLSFQLVLMLQKDAQYNLRITRAWRGGTNLLGRNGGDFPGQKLKSSLIRMNLNRR